MRRTEFRALGGSRVYKGAIWGKQIGNPGYYLCGLSGVDPRYAKYPVLPVTDCAGFVRREPGRG